MVKRSGDNSRRCQPARSQFTLRQGVDVVFLATLLIQRHCLILQIESYILKHENSLFFLKTLPIPS